MTCDVWRTHAHASDTIVHITSLSLQSSHRSAFGGTSRYRSSRLGIDNGAGGYYSPALSANMILNVIFELDIRLMERIPTRRRCQPPIHTSYFSNVSTTCSPTCDSYTHTQTTLVFRIWRTSEKTSCVSYRLCKLYVTYFKKNKDIMTLHS